MNKLQGFYELQQSGLPTVPWKRYEKGIQLDNSLLWTIRCAVLSGEDLNLPREVGVTATRAQEFANGLIDQLGEDNLIIYYPFFIADKSGVLEVKENGIVIEAVKDDLWNLVTYNKVDTSIVITADESTIRGDSDFLTQEELLELIDYSKVIKIKYKSVFYENKSLFLEWSYTYESSIEKERLGRRKLVFYELRSVNVGR